MGHQHGDIEILDDDGQVIIKLDSNDGSIELGNENADGDVHINDSNGNRTIHLNGEGAHIRAGGQGSNGRATFFRAEEANPNSDTKASIYINGDRGNTRLGGNGVSGRMALFRSGISGEDLYNYSEIATVSIDGGSGNLQLGNNGVDGDLLVNNRNGERTIHLNGDDAAIRVGGRGANGRAMFYRAEEDSPNSDTDASIYINGDRGNIRLGGNGVSARFAMFSSSTTGDDLYNYNDIATLALDGSNGNLQLGNNGVDGDLLMNDRNGNRTIHLSGDGAQVRVGGHGANGRATFFRAEEDNPDSDTKASIYINGDRGNMRVGGNGVDGRMAFFRSETSGEDLYNYDGLATIQLLGSSGDIILKNADCAEEFDIYETDQAEPGSVMTLGDDGSLHESSDAYDKRVVGVISGAGEYKPGIILDRKDTEIKRMPIALMGKVYCKVDAKYGSIEIGDLLTTSPTPGHAMKSGDMQKAFGATIGKALAPWNEGAGMIPVLIALQ